MGYEKVPHDFGLTGDHSSDIANGARTKGLPEPRTSTSFLGRGRRKDCIFRYSEGL